GDPDFGSKNPSAAHKWVIAVSATTVDDTWDKESNYGAGVSFCAPQVLVTCDSTGGIAYDLSGHTAGPLIYYPSFGETSAATALSAGVAALVLSACPELTWGQVKKILEDTANPIDQAGGAYYDTNGDLVPDYSDKYGHGRVDAAAAVSKALEYCAGGTPPG